MGLRSFDETQFRTIHVSLRPYPARKEEARREAGPRWPDKERPKVGATVGSTTNAARPVVERLSLPKTRFERIDDVSRLGSGSLKRGSCGCAQFLAALLKTAARCRNAINENQDPLIIWAAWCPNAIDKNYDDENYMEMKTIWARDWMRARIFCLDCAWL